MWLLCSFPEQAKLCFPEVSNDVPMAFLALEHPGTVSGRDFQANTNEMPSFLMSGQEILEGDAIIPHICKQLWEFDAALPEAVDSRKEHDSGV